MPKIRRWFPVSHDINSDPEMWALTDQFGDRGLRAWLELLSIADRNDGLVTIPPDDLVRALSIKLNTTQDRMRRALRWFEERSWTVRDPVLRVRNYLHYHKNRGNKRAPSQTKQTKQTKQNLHNNKPEELLMPDWLDMTAWQEYRDYRKKIGHPMTEHAEVLAIKKLGQLKEHGNDPTEVINQSILSSWSGLFEVKTGKGHPDHAFSERTQRILKRGL